MVAKIQALDVEQPSFQSEAPASRNAMLSMQLLLALNAALMFTALLFGWSVYDDVSRKYDGMHSLLSNPQELGALADGVMREAISSFVFGSDYQSSFILGAVNGSVAQFVSNMLRADYYAQTAAQLESFSRSMMASFPSNASSCEKPMTCPSNPDGQYPYSMQCSTGKMVWCNYPGENVNCANQTCIAHYVFSVASLVNSVSSLVEQLGGPEQSSNSGAAFNSGLLNIEAVIPWVGKQANPWDWNAAGARCLDLTTRVKSIAWNGAYVDFGGHTHHFNVSDKVAEGADYAQQICNDLVKLTESFMQSSRHEGHQHHHGDVRVSHHDGARHHHRK